MVVSTHPVHVAIKGTIQAIKSVKNNPHLAAWEKKAILFEMEYDLACQAANPKCGYTEVIVLVKRQELVLEALKTYFD